MPFKQISPAEAKGMLQTSSATLVDIRDMKSFNRSHAPEALLLTSDNLFDFIEETDKNSPVLVICYHGNSSQIVAESLSSAGFNDVYSIIGGYEAW